MKNFAATLLCISLVGVCGCVQTPAAPSLADAYAGVEELMTQAEVTALTGPPATKRTATFPAGPFMGPQEGMIGIIAPGQPYAEWEYVGGGNIYLIFFAGGNVDDPPNQWNVVGKATYPQGAVF